jgi:hypothetical protein
MPTAITSKAPLWNECAPRDPEICPSRPRDRRFIVSPHSYRPGRPYEDDPKDQTRRGCRPCAEAPFGPCAVGFPVVSRDGGSSYQSQGPRPVAEAVTATACKRRCEVLITPNRRQEAWSVRKSGGGPRSAVILWAQLDLAASSQPSTRLGPDAAYVPGRRAYRSVQQGTFDHLACGLFMSAGAAHVSHRGPTARQGGLNV